MFVLHEAVLAGDQDLQKNAPTTVVLLQHQVQARSRGALCGAFAALDMRVVLEETLE